VYTHLNVTFKHDYKFTKDHFVPINMPSLETIRIHVEPPTSESRYKNPADYRKLPFALIQHLRPSTVVLRSENAIHQAILPPIQDLLKEAHTFTLVSGAAVNRVWNFFTTFNLPPAVKTFSIVILTNKACLYGNIRGLNKTYSSWHWNEESAKVSHLDRALNAIMRKASGTKHEDFKINWVHFDKPAPLNLILAFNHEITIPTTRGPLLQEMDTVFTNMGAMPYGFGTAGPKVPKLCPVQFIDTTQFISTEDWNAAFDEDEIEPWFHPSWTQQERNWRANRAPVWGGIDWLCERTFGQYELTEQEKLSNDEMIAETEKIFDNVTDEQRDIFGRRKRAKVE
jgi:hypothetical protein